MSTAPHDTVAAAAKTSEVAMVRWPNEEELAELRAVGRPRLVLLDDTSTPPEPVDCLEDWIRVPAREEDIGARILGLQRRHAAHAAGVPEVEDHVLRWGSLWVPLAPVEARLVEALVAGFGRVTSRQHLLEAGWPSATPERNVLDVHMLHVRRKVASVGLAVRTIRSRGYLLEAGPS